ncbi:MAG: response regulator [Kiritimatiellae bacterium]|nr:response regulator [Kiritimatiellia bacterium]
MARFLLLHGAVNTYTETKVTGTQPQEDTPPRTAYPPCPILIVDDEAEVLFAFATELRLAGLTNLRTFDDPRDVVPALGRHGAAVVLLDLAMPHLRGEALLARIVAEHPDVPVIVISAADDARTAAACMKGGACDYLCKPLEHGRLVRSVEQALARRTDGHGHDRLPIGEEEYHA